MKLILNLHEQGFRILFSVLQGTFHHGLERLFLKRRCFFHLAAQNLFHEFRMGILGILGIIHHPVNVLTPVDKSRIDKAMFWHLHHPVPMTCFDLILILHIA